MSSSASGIFRRLRGLVADAVGVEESEVEPESSFEEDLNIDHQELVDLMVAIEEEFGVEISESEMGQMETVGDAVELLEDKLA